MAYNLKWPGLEDLDVYIIDHETKLIYDKERRLPARLNYINTLEHKYVRLIDVVSLFASSMKVRVLNLVETLSSISSLKPLHKDRETELRFLHLSSLLAFILVYPFCKPFEKTRDALLRYLMGYSETVCMDCGFIQRECQCNVFYAENDEVDGEDMTEVVCKVTEWKSTATQTDASDSSAQKVVFNLPEGLTLKTPDGRILLSGSGANVTPQLGPVPSGPLPTVMTPTLMPGPAMYNMPTPTQYTSALNPPQPMSSSPFNFLGTPALSLGGYVRPPTSIVTVTPPNVHVQSQAPNPENRINIKLGSNVLCAPSADTKKADNLGDTVSESSEKLSSSKLFKLDPITGMFESNEFSLNPKTGKVTKKSDVCQDDSSTKQRAELGEVKNIDSGGRTKQIIVKGSQIYVEADEDLDQSILRGKKKKKKKKTVKDLLKKAITRDEEKAKKNEARDENADTTKTNDKPSATKEHTHEAVDKGKTPDDEQEPPSVGDRSDSEQGNIEKRLGKSNGNENAEVDDVDFNTTDKTEDRREGYEISDAENRNEPISPETSETAKKRNEEEDMEVEDSKQDDSKLGESNSKSNENSESSEEDEETDSETSGEDEDVQVLDGVRYRVITPKAAPTVKVKPPQLKVKMPFGEKRKPAFQTAVKPSQKLLMNALEKPATPGSILAKCNFSYASSPTTGAPILQPAKKLKPASAPGAAVVKSASGPSGNKASFSMVPEDSADAGKGYAKFEFAQTGEKMLRCVIHTCGQVFDTERFAEIHQTLHRHGTSKELSCKLCDFKGHVLKWYDMLRHLKQTHGSVLEPKILPPKPKKEDKKSEEEKETGPTPSKDDKMSEDGKEIGPSQKDEKQFPEKSENEENKNVEDKEIGSSENNKNSGLTSGVEQESKENNEGNISHMNTRSPKLSPVKTEGQSPTVNISAEEEKTKDPVILKSDGLSALAAVCDQLKPLDTNSLATEESKEKQTSNEAKSTFEKTSDIKKIVSDENDVPKEAQSESLLGEGNKNGLANFDQKKNGEVGERASPEKTEATLEVATNDKEDAKNSEEAKVEESNMCDLCGITFDTKKELDRHSTFHYYNKYKCIHCGSIMYTWAHLQRHLKECADVDKGRIYYNCQYCHLSFRDRKSHYIHSISHGDPGLVCSYCDDDKSWDNWTALKKHYKVFHMAMRLLSAFKCDECNREFNTAKQYNNHVQDHKRRKERAAKMNKADQKEIDDMKDLEIEVTADGLVKCPDCDQTFKNNHYMHMHHKFKHGEEITCPKCSFVAKSKLMLKIHMGKQHVEKSHKCAECSKTFAHYHQYKVHMSTHAQKTTFTCKFCQAGYPTNGELRQHMLKEHKLPAHKKLIQCEDCDFKCFSRTTLKAHSRKNHPETSIAEDGEDHCYFNKKEPSPPPKAVKKKKQKEKAEESVEKMMETKSKYFLMRHNTCCRTRSFEQNMEIKNRKVAAERRSLEGPKKRGRKPKSALLADVETEEQESAEKKDPTWSPAKDDLKLANNSSLSSPNENSSRRSSFTGTATPMEDFSQQDAHKIHENRAPNKRRSAPPKRYSPEREVIPVKRRAKSPPLRRPPRSPKERRTGKYPSSKKKGYDSNDPLNPNYLQQYPPFPSSTSRGSAQALKERRKSAKQYEKKLKHEKPTLYAELMHVKKLKSVPMVVDHSAPIPLPLLDHGYCRESRPQLVHEQYEDSAYENPDLNIVSTPDVADFEECLTDDVEISVPMHSYTRSPASSSRILPAQSNRPESYRQRGRPPGRGTGRTVERKGQAVAMRGVLTGGSVSTLQLSNNVGQISKLGSSLSNDGSHGVNIRISGAGTSASPNAASQYSTVKTVMAPPDDDSMEFDSDTYLPSGVEMQDDILKVAADMFIGESEIAEENTESSYREEPIAPNLIQSAYQGASNAVVKYPKPIVITRGNVQHLGPSFDGRSTSRVITISAEGLVRDGHPRVVTQSVPSIQTDQPAVVTETLPQYPAQEGGAVEMNLFRANEDIVEETTLQDSGAEDPAYDTVSVTLSESNESSIPQASNNSGPLAASSTVNSIQYHEDENEMPNEMAQELVQVILNHSRSSETELDDIQLNEADYEMLLDPNGESVISTAVTTCDSIGQSVARNTQQGGRSLDHQYF